MRDRLQAPSFLSAYQPSGCSAKYTKVNPTTIRVRGTIVEFPAFALAYLRNRENDFEVELTLNRDRKEHYAHGDRHGRVAVGVNCVARERERLAQVGCALTARWSGHRTARSPYGRSASASRSFGFRRHDRVGRACLAGVSRPVATTRKATSQLRLSLVWVETRH